MNCSEARAHLPVLSDGELTAEMREPVEAHLSGCPDCRNVVDRWRALRSAANRATRAIAVPDDLSEQVGAMLANQRGQKLHRRRWAGTGLISAAALLLVAVAVWKFGAFPTNDRIEPVNPSVVVVSAAQFAQFHGICADANRYHCDKFKIRQQTVSFARASIGEQVTFAVAVPDLAERGYSVDGGCTCLKLDRTVDRSVHVYYRRTPRDPNPISIYSISEQVRLPGPPDSVEREGKRAYQEAVSDDVVVLMWREEGGSYAACAKLPKEELYDVVDSLDIAAVVGAAPRP